MIQHLEHLFISFMLQVPFVGFSFTQLLNYKTVELDFALCKVCSIFIASTGTLKFRKKKKMNWKYS